MVELEAVTKRFGNIVAVDGLTFAIRSGEVLGLLGENGAGKTTTIRMMATVLRPTAGDIRIAGHSVRTEPMQVRRQIGLLFGGEAGLYSRLTARENITYFGRLYGLAEQRLNQRVRELSQALGMEEYIDRRVGGFSRGMKQKVAIARDLVDDPQVILFDEPTTGLDVSAASIFRKLISELRGSGKTILFSSHNMAEVERLCDRVVLLHKGKLRFDGTLSRLRQQYALTDLDEIFLRAIGSEDSE